MGGKGYIKFLLIFMVMVGFTLTLYPLVPPEKANLDDLNSAILILQKARKEKDMKTVSATTQWLKRAVPLVISAFLRKNFCKASRNDIDNAIILLKFSRIYSSFPMESGITEWLRMGFRNHAHRRLSEGATPEELLELGKEALSMGLGDVAEALSSGKSFPSECEEVWHGTLVWLQKNTPPVESVDIWNEMKISMEFHIAVMKNGRIKGLGSGKTENYSLKIVCRDGREKGVPVEIIDKVFPVTLSGIKGKNTFKIKPSFQARIDLGEARMECSESNVGEVLERTIDLGRILSNALYFYEDGMLKLNIKENTSVLDSDETGLHIRLKRIK